MISDEAIAAKVNAELLNVVEQLNESIILVMETCQDEEFKAYRLAMARVLGEIFEILDPLYRRHPTIKPPEFDDDRDDALIDELVKGHASKNPVDPGKQAT